MIKDLLFYALIGGLFSLIGGLIVLWKSALANRIMTTLISFGAGAFLAAVFLDILPEALEQNTEPQPVLIAVLSGFILFFILERFMMRYIRRNIHEKTHSDHTESLPFLIILGDSIHNFLDGIVIAIAFTANPLLGLPTALAIAAHEIPQEIGDFSILLKLKWSKKNIIAVNIIQSLLTIPGVLLGFYMGRLVEPHLPLFLGMTSGIFLYIGAADLIPELHHQSGHRHFFRVIIPFILSVVLIYIFVSIAHGTEM